MASSAHRYIILSLKNDYPYILTADAVKTLASSSRNERPLNVSSSFNQFHILPLPL